MMEFVCLWNGCCIQGIGVDYNIMFASAYVGVWSEVGCVVITDFAGLLFDGQGCPYLECFLHAHLT